MSLQKSLADIGINAEKIYHNPTPAKLYELALAEGGSAIAATGALIAKSGTYTGRSPKAKRLVEQPASKDDIWWGEINRPLSEQSFEKNRALATSFLSGRPHLYVIDAFIAWEPTWKKKVRIVCARAYHALFMWNMLVRPTAEELADFGTPEWVVLNAGQQLADQSVEGVDSEVSVTLNIARQEFVILGTEYAGEMKKGLFTVLNYLLPKAGDFPMHCSANMGADGETALFFGLSGTGKTTLSADPDRKLIGDDEHGWWDGGIFNFEGGCYAKMIKLSAEGEPEIWNAIRWGTVLENVIYDEQTHVVDYDDTSITQNTRGAYPIEHIDNALIPCLGGHPKTILFLTCDAFGVLPPISRLTPGQAMYHFISGYTAKVAGTEAGVDEPEATFSSCFGAPFLVWHPTVYAELLKQKMETHRASVWLINTGWTGGPHGVGSRMKLSHTRTLVTAALEGKLNDGKFETEPFFGLSIPTSCEGVPSEVLSPQKTWSDPAAYQKKAEQLAGLFHANFETYASEASTEILEAAPRIGAAK